MSSLQKRIMKNKLPPRVPRSVGPKVASFGGGRTKDYTPVPWKKYFEKYEDVETESGTFRVYMSKEPEKEDTIRILALHGGGYSGLSWALFTEEITSMLICQVLAMDIRGHGETKVKDPEDLSGDTLAKDVEEVLIKLYNGAPPPLIVMGHSMGGAVAVRASTLAAVRGCLRGVTVIDVVEGTAMESLASMQSFLRSRPTHFRSIEHAVEWCVRSGQVRNVDSAKVSMPSQIVNVDTGLLATNEVENYKPSMEPCSPSEPLQSPDAIAEVEEGEGEGEVEGEGEGENKMEEFVKPLPSVGAKYSWRIDLSRTERHWAGWFSGLSAAFLAAPAPRLLLLASIEGLDRELTVGQMQGKFQMQVLPRSGHAVHEDRPDEVAKIVAAFALRHRLATPAEGYEHLALVPGC